MPTTAAALRTIATSSEERETLGSGSKDQRWRWQLAAHCGGAPARACPVPVAIAACFLAALAERPHWLMAPLKCGSPWDSCTMDSCDRVSGKLPEFRLFRAAVSAKLPGMGLGARDARIGPVSEWRVIRLEQGHTLPRAGLMAIGEWRHTLFAWQDKTDRQRRVSKQPPLSAPKAAP